MVGLLDHNPPPTMSRTLSDPSELNPRWNRARNKAWMAACVAVQVFHSEIQRKKMEIEIPNEVEDIYSDILLVARTCVEALKNQGMFFPNLNTSRDSPKPQ